MASNSPNREVPTYRVHTVGCFLFTLLFVFGLQSWRGGIGLVWDEPPHLERHYALREWWGTLFADPVRAFSSTALSRGWPFCRVAPDEHPPASAVIRVICWKLMGGFVDPLTAHRLGTILLFAVLVACVFRTVAQRWGLLAGVAGASVVLFHPRVFAHGHFADMDMAVASTSFLAATVFLRCCETGRRSWLFGLMLGVACMSKATGVLVWPAMLLWTLSYRVRNGFKCLGWSILLTPLTIVVLNPGWWRNPIAGIWQWIDGMLHYPQKIPVYYFGVTYDAKETFPPWHHPWVMVGMTIPVGLLILAALGFVFWVGSVSWRRRSEVPQPEETTFLPAATVAGWAAISFLLPMLLRMVAVLPIHDGVRQLVMIFAPLGVLAGYAVHVMQLHLPTAFRWAARCAVLAAVGISAGELVHSHPYELNYYNQLIGGPIGAERAGMETTYYWDAVNRSTLAWMNENLPPGAKVLIFPPPDVRIFQWYQRWRWVRTDLDFQNLDDGQVKAKLALLATRPDYYMLFQRRQGIYAPSKKVSSPLMLELSQSPALYEVKPPQIGVRLAAVFSNQQFAEVAGRSRSED